MVQVTRHQLSPKRQLLSPEVSAAEYALLNEPSVELAEPEIEVDRGTSCLTGGVGVPGVPLGMKVGDEEWRSVSRGRAVLHHRPSARARNQFHEKKRHICLGMINVH